MKRKLLAVTIAGLISSGIVYAESHHGAGSGYGAPGSERSHFDDRGTCPYQMNHQNMHQRFSGEGRGAFMGQMMRDLELTDAQRKELDTFRDELREQSKARHEAASKVRRDIRNLDPADKDYLKQLEKLAAEKGKLATQSAMAHGQMRAKFHSILTDEQRQKLQKKREEMRQQCLATIKERRQQLDELEKKVKAQ